MYRYVTQPAARLPHRAQAMAGCFNAGPENYGQSKEKKGDTFKMDNRRSKGSLYFCETKPFMSFVINYFPFWEAIL
jgi:hypothetical protein